MLWNERWLAIYCKLLIGGLIPISLVHLELIMFGVTADLEDALQALPLLQTLTLWPEQVSYLCFSVLYIDIIGRAWLMQLVRFYRDSNICATFFSAQANSAFHPSEVNEYQCLLGANLRWISVPSRGVKDSNPFNIQKLEISAFCFTVREYISSVVSKTFLHCNNDSLITIWNL